MASDVKANYIPTHQERNQSQEKKRLVGDTPIEV